MMQTLNKMKEKLEKESSEHKHVKQQVTELNQQLHELSTVRVLTHSTVAAFAQNPNIATDFFFFLQVITEKS